MPKIPRFTGDPHVDTTKRSIFNAGEIPKQDTRPMVEMSENFKEAARKYKQFEDLNDFTEASNCLTTDMNDIRTAAANDPDLKGKEEKYIKQLNDAYNKHFESLSPNMKNQFNASVYPSILSNQFSIRQGVRNEKVAQFKNNIALSEDNNIRLFASGSPQDKATARLNHFNIIDAAVAFGANTKEEGEILKERFDKEAPLKAASTDLSSITDIPSMNVFIKDLEDNAYGIKDKADIEKFKKAAYDELNSIHAKQNIMTKVQQYNRYTQLRNELENGESTMTSIDYENEGQSGGLTSEDAKALATLKKYKFLNGQSEMDKVFSWFDQFAKPIALRGGLEGKEEITEVGRDIDGKRIKKGSDQYNSILLERLDKLARFRREGISLVKNNVLSPEKFATYEKVISYLTVQVIDKLNDPRSLSTIFDVFAQTGQPEMFDKWMYRIGAEIQTLEESQDKSKIINDEQMMKIAQEIWNSGQIAKNPTLMVAPEGTNATFISNKGLNVKEEFKLPGIQIYTTETGSPRLSRKKD